MADISFGTAIRIARDSVGVKQYELADKVGMIRTNLTRLERGNPKNPGIPTRTKLAAGLGMTVDEVMEIGRKYVAEHPAVEESESPVAESADQMESARRIKRMVDVVDWDRARENEIYEKLLEFACEDAQRRAE